MRVADISRYQGTVNFDQLKTGVSAVIIRAGYSGGGIDSQLRRNQSEARRVGLSRGYYWFAYPDRIGAAADADKFITTVGALQPGEWLVLDYEVAAGGVPWCRDFLNRINDRLGYKAFLYTNQNRVVTMNWSSVKNAGHPLWVAIFDNNPDKAVNTAGWAYPMKQFTADGRLPGISGAVDLNEFYGDVNKFLSYGYKGGYMLTKEQIIVIYNGFFDTDDYQVPQDIINAYIGKPLDGLLTQLHNDPTWLKHKVAVNNPPGFEPVTEQLYKKK